MERQLQETVGGSDGRSEESVPSKSHVRGPYIMQMIPGEIPHANYAGKMKVLKPIRPQFEVTGTSSKQEIKYLSTGRGTDMRSEINRYCSLNKYNDPRPAPLYSLQTLLSWAGFYYVGPGDRVRCFSCGGELENWENWDVPLTRHRLSFPDCPYVRGWRAEVSPIFGQYQYPHKKSLLFPMSERLSQTVPSSSNCPTVQGRIKDPDYSKVKSITEGESETSAPPSGSSISGQKPLGTISDENNRLETYRRHRHHFPHNNQRSLSRAGFYYVGPGDRVRCFSCGGELENWERWDDPPTRHQRSFPDCPYVRGQRAEVSPIFGQYQYQRKKSSFLPMSERLGQTVLSGSNCPTVQGQIKDPDYSKVESITEGESETPAPPSGSSISGQKSLGTMRDKYNRLETYRGHRHHFPYNNQRSLSRAGFYYVGPGDRVRCFSCGGELDTWEYWDVSLNRHQRSFPDCPYVLELRAEMSPIFGQSQTVSASERLSQTVPSSSNCPTVQGLIKDPDYSKVKSITEGESETPASPSGSSISGQKSLGTMRDKHNRLETYRGHRHHFPHNNQWRLSWAGFYYVGPGDRVRCFSCEGELENWEDWDDPLTQHQLSFPDCPYVLEAKRLLNLSTESNKYLNYRNNSGLPHIKNKGKRLSQTVPNSSMTHCDKTESTDQEEGLSDPKKEGASGQVEKGISGQVQEGTSGLEEEEISGLVQEGTSGQVEEGISGQVEEGTSGQVEEGTSGQVEEEISGQVEEGVSGQVGKGISGHVKVGASGQVEVEPRVQKEETCDWPRGSAEECELCGKKPEVPRISPQRSGTKYRLELPYKGRFCCSETGIQFCVESPTSIEFEFGSWDEYLGHLEQYSYHIVSPLFHITIKCGWVSEVYLPHYVCLGGGHVVTEEFKVVHYKDDNMVLETPAEVLPFYVVLKQPTFSPIGILLLRKLPSRVRRNIPTHGAVFLYSRYITGYTLHLYFMPQDPSLKRALDMEEDENGFSSVVKPPKTNTVFSHRIYSVEGPANAEINPKDLRLSFGDSPAMYDYSEIYLLNIDVELPLSLKCQTSQRGIWDAVLRREDLMPRSQMAQEDLMPRSQMAQDVQRFITRHRADLIARVSNIDPVLDDLLANEILTQEQYDTVRNNRTSQEKMRQLYEYVRSWGQFEKEMFYRTLSAHNRALIRDLL